MTSRTFGTSKAVIGSVKGKKKEEVQLHELHLHLQGLRHDDSYESKQAGSTCGRVKLG